MAVFAGWSYQEVVTPTIDYFALFERGMGREAEQAFRFTDNDGGLLAMRPDVTSSVARLSATLLRDSPRPLRLCYASTVFRQQQQSHVEWRRENTQLGCELIGASGLASDLEVLLIAAEILTSLGLRDSACITVNNVEVFNGLLDTLSIGDEFRSELRRLVDTRDKSELARLLSTLNKNDQAIHTFERFTELTGKGEILSEARTLVADDRSTNGLARLAQLWNVLVELGLQDLFEIDLADVSGLDYYTGLSFKIFVRGAGYRIGRGGRYDGLIANFGKTEPAVGFVLSLDSLTEVLNGFSSPADKQPVSIEISESDTAASFREILKSRRAGQLVQLEEKP